MTHKDPVSTRDTRPDTRLQTGTLKPAPAKPKKAGKSKAAVEGKEGKPKKSGKAKATKKSPGKSPAKSPVKRKGKAISGKGRGRSPRKSVPVKQVIAHGVEEPWESEASTSRVSRILPLDDQQRAANLAEAQVSSRVDDAGQSLPQTPVETLPRPSSRKGRRMKQIDTGMLSHAGHVSGSDSSSLSVSSLCKCLG